MTFVNNETNEEVDFSLYENENQNVLTLLLAGKTVMNSEIRYFKIRQDQEIFNVIDDELTVELIEIMPEDL